MQAGGDALALWAAVVAVGAWHGVNPAMGWPLAVANGLTTRRGSAVFATLLPLAAGHLLAMAVVLLPFTLLGSYLAWNRQIRLAGGALVLLFGLYRLVQPRHPRWFARIRPTQLLLWSFVMASAHGAGLMLLPFALALCAPSSALGGAALGLTGMAGAAVVAAVHTTAMLLTGIAVAWLVYRTIGLRVLTRGWLNLDALWGASLVVAGAASLAMV